MPRTAPRTEHSLLDVLNQRQAQARNARRTYLAPVADEDSMLFWLAQAAKSARESADRKQVHVAAGADVDQSTIWRFEQAGAWPRNTDRVVAAYADDLDVDNIDLWEEAMRLWREHRAAMQQHDPLGLAEGTERLRARQAPDRKTPPAREATPERRRRANG
jgi:hypothetical protein